MRLYLDSSALVKLVTIGGDLRSVLTYDLRMQDAAKALGIAVDAPA
ncbi:MAG TPA: hypothetical protein VKU88_08625 [Acidimicrobiales bacterium]|nr:hypothetical protein [Acidimicrobiales bacterium]